MRGEPVGAVHALLDGSTSSEWYLAVASEVELVVVVVGVREGSLDVEPRLRTRLELHVVNVSDVVDVRVRS